MRKIITFQIGTDMIGQPIYYSHILFTNSTKGYYHR